mmetsp:Transcript_3605/g.8522  ORF Transcript_3605/g.8522 Transcript_3605/m.8522 type:complete len:282 (+) Transcript_3605:15-860(+)
MVLGMGAGGGGGPASSPSEWFNSLPWVTRVWFCASMFSTVAMHANLINPLTLAHLHEFTFGKLQVWRLVTNFCFLGKFSFAFLMTILFLIQFSSQLEKDYQGRTSEYLWVVLLGASCLLTLNGLLDLGMYFGSVPLIFYVMYIWCRRHPHTQMSIFGLFNISAAYLPFFHLMMTSLMGGSIMEMGLGVLVGHLFHFLNDLHPWTAGARVFQPPQLLRDLVKNEAGAPPGVYRSANSGQGSWARAQGNPAPAGAGAGAGAGGAGGLFRSSGHQWGPGRRLVD